MANFFDQFDDASPSPPRDDATLAAMRQVESGGNDYAVSPKGAEGPMQVMPDTQRSPGYGVMPARDHSPAELRRVGEDYYAAMLRKYNGNRELALAAYNAGPGQVDEWLGRQSEQQLAQNIPFPETRNYVRQVTARAGQQAAPNFFDQFDNAAPMHTVTPAAAASGEGGYATEFAKGAGRGVGRMLPQAAAGFAEFGTDIANAVGFEPWNLGVAEKSKAAQKWIETALAPAKGWENSYTGQVGEAAGTIAGYAGEMLVPGVGLGLAAGTAAGQGIDVAHTVAEQNGASAGQRVAADIGIGAVNTLLTAIPGANRVLASVPALAWPGITGYAARTVMAGGVGVGVGALQMALSDAVEKATINPEKVIGEGMQEQSLIMGLASALVHAGIIEPHAAMQRAAVPAKPGEPPPPPQLALPPPREVDVPTLGRLPTYTFDNWLNANAHTDPEINAIWSNQHIWGRDEAHQRIIDILTNRAADAEITRRAEADPRLAEIWNAREPTAKQAVHPEGHPLAGEPVFDKQGRPVMEVDPVSIERRREAAINYIARQELGDIVDRMRPDDIKRLQERIRRNLANTAQEPPIGQQRGSTPSGIGQGAQEPGTYKTIATPEPATPGQRAAGEGRDPFGIRGKPTAEDEGDEWEPPREPPPAPPPPAPPPGGGGAEIPRAPIEAPTPPARPPIEAPSAPEGPAAQTGVPFVMTAAMRKALADRGYTPAQIKNLTPAQAHAILATVSPAGRATPVSPPTQTPTPTGPPPITTRPPPTLPTPAQGKPKYGLPNARENIEFARTGQATERVGIAADIKRLIEMFGPKMYSGDLPEVTMKELLQNAWDGVKAAYANGTLKPGQGRVSIHVDSENRILTVRDNGAGMTGETVKDAFLTLGGTEKGGLSQAERSGGFGLAKMAFIFGNDGLQLMTVKDGVGTALNTTGKELLDGKSELRSFRTDVPNGTVVRVKIPETYKDEKSGDQKIYMPTSARDFETLKKPLIGDVAVHHLGSAEDPLTGEGTPLAMGRHIDLSQTPKFTTAHFSWGDIDVYLGNKKHAVTYWTKHSALSSGLYQFDPDVPASPTGYEKMPYDIIMDVRPKVDADNKYYPFTKQREGFNPTIKKDIGALVNYLQKVSLARQASEVGSRFLNAGRYPNTAHYNDAGLTAQLRRKEIAPKDLQLEGLLPKKDAFVVEKAPEVDVKNGEVRSGRKVLGKDKDDFTDKTVSLDAKNFSVPEEYVPHQTPIFHSNLNIDLVKEAARRSGIPEGRLHYVVARFGSIVKEFQRELAAVPGYEEYGTKPKVGGVSLDKEYHGVHIRVPYEGFFLNPFAQRLTSPEALAEAHVHTLIHEATHTKVSGHTESFTIALAKLYGDLPQHSPKIIDNLRANIRALIEQHKAAFDALRETYHDPSTRNAKASEGTALGAESGRTAPEDAANRGPDYQRVEGGEAGRDADRLRGVDDTVRAREPTGAGYAPEYARTGTAGGQPPTTPPGGTRQGSGGPPERPPPPGRTAPLAREPERATSWGRGAAQHIADRWMKTIQPEQISEGAYRADADIAKMAATRQQMRDHIEHTMFGEWNYWRKVPEQERLQFMDQVERGAVPANSPHAAKAQMYRALLEKANAEERAAGSKQGYVENYFPHIWEDVQKARAFMEARSQQVGPSWFQKPRTYDYIQEGLAAGLKLRDSNPAELLRMRLLSGADMRAKMGMLDDLKMNGLAMPRKEMLGAPGGGQFEATNEPRRGWTSIVAPNRTQWWLRDDIMPAWKNGVDAKGLWAAEGLGGDAFRSWMSLKNLWVPIKLAISAFHPIHIAHINFSNSMSRAALNLFRGEIGNAAGDIINAFNLRGGAIGRAAREAWLKDYSTLSPSEKLLVDTMREGGFQPQLAEELRIGAKKTFLSALDNQQYLKAAFNGAKLPIETMQKAIFDRWIPNLKAAAYMHEAQQMMARRPELADDPAQRRIALRQIAKSIDNRFGEMAYNTLLINRTLKDAGIGSFLSLSWNLGFLREFGGGLALDPAMKAARKAGVLGVTPDQALAQSVRSRTAFAIAYTTTAMIIAGMMTKLATGEDPKGMDYFLPRVAGKNPDGTERRLSSPFFTREVPQWMKHEEEQNSWLWGTTDMLYNKMLFQPFKEIYQNRDYWGYDIADVNASVEKQAMQYLAWFAKEQFDPLTISQYNRVKETGGSETQEVLSFMGFGPAPSYAARTAIQNRIEHLYTLHVAPTSRPHDEKEMADAKRAVKVAMGNALQNGNDQQLFKALEDAQRLGVPLKNFFQGKKSRQPGDIVLFAALPAEDQEAIMRQANADERKRYWAWTHKNIRARIAQEVESQP